MVKKERQRDRSHNHSKDVTPTVVRMYRVHGVTVEKTSHVLMGDVHTSGSHGGHYPVDLFGTGLLMNIKASTTIQPGL